MTKSLPNVAMSLEAAILDLRANDINDKRYSYRKK